MLETRASVIRVEGAEAIVEAQPSGGCGACSGGGGCGGAGLSRTLCVRPRQFRVRNSVGARVGDEVQVVVADGVLLRSALTLYGLPLLLVFAGAAFGAQWMAGSGRRDAGAVIGAVAGLLAGFILARFIASRQRASLPAIIHCESIRKSAIL